MVIFHFFVDTHTKMAPWNTNLEIYQATNKQTSLASFSASRQSTKVQKYKKCKDVKNVKSTKNTKVKNKIKTPAISIKKHYK